MINFANSFGGGVDVGFERVLRGWRSKPRDGCFRFSRWLFEIALKEERWQSFENALLFP